MKLSSLLVSLLVAGTSASTEWFDCNPFFGTPSVSNPTTALFDRHGKKLRDMLDDFHQREYEEKRKRATITVPYSSKCTMLRPPLDHSNPTGPSIDLFVKCYSLSSSSTGVMFVLQGGPGGSSIAMEGIMDPVVREVGNQYDVCTLDFRGVFRSNALYCHANQASTPGSDGGCAMTAKEAKDCREGLGLSTDLTHYSTTQAAHDLMYAINKYTPAKSKVAIYGVSYGTYFLGRFSQIYPNAANILIFDSVVNMAGQYIATFDQWDTENDYVLKEYLKRCKSDSFCTSKMTEDPLAFATKVMNNVFSDASTCQGVKDVFETKQGFVLALYGLMQRLELRTLVLSLFYRMNMCRSKDIITIENLFSALGGSSSQGTCLTDDSEVVYTNVISAELFNAKLTRQNIIDNGNSLTFNGGVALFLYEIREGWLFRTDTQYYNKTLSPSGQILVLGSDLDPQTVITSTQNFYDNLNVTANQAYLGISVGGVHATITTSSSSQLDCGFDIVNEFILNPKVQPDFTCLGKTFTDDYKGDILAYLLGIDDIYESVYSSAGFNSPMMVMLIAIVSFAFAF